MNDWYANECNAVALNLLKEKERKKNFSCEFQKEGCRISSQDGAEKAFKSLKALLNFNVSLNFLSGIICL